jgi:small-conductance mechanosensitive channel
MIFPYLPGSGSAGFKGVSVFVGLLLSLGAATAIGNVIAGVVITYMRPFRIGDRVKIADAVGDVLDKDLFVVRLRTIKNVDITVPNSLVLANHIINFTSGAEQQRPAMEAMSDTWSKPISISLPRRVSSL